MAEKIVQDPVEMISYAHFPDIKGDSVEVGYEGWIKVTSLQVRKRYPKNSSNNI